jgi:hypothetical protein
MGPESAKTYPGQAVVAGQRRATQEIDYGRRGGGYIFGAFRPATGEAFTHPYAGRSTASWVDFLAQVERWLPEEAGRVDAIVDNLSTHRDNLSTHRATDVLLFMLAGSPALGDGLPAHLRRLPQPDRAVVEGAALPGAQGPPVRELG